MFFSPFRSARASLSLSIFAWGVGCTLLAGLISGCATDGSEHAIANAGADGGSYLRFNIEVNPNGKIDLDNNGYYAILLNSQGETIEATDLDTFTDFIRFDGINFDWYTRQANLPNSGFTFIQVGSLNTAGSVVSDGRSLQVLLDLNDSTNYINQYIVGDKFSAQVITTDTYKGAYLGRILDCMGPGIDFNSQQTLLISKLLGAVSPFPSYYPDDSLNDWVSHDDLDSDYPYGNFDIASFQVVSTSN